MIRKCGLLTFSETDRNKSCTRDGKALLPFIKYLLRPPMTTCRDTVISSKASYPRGLCCFTELSNVIVTVALVTPACPPL